MTPLTHPAKKLTRWTARSGMWGSSSIRVYIPRPPFQCSPTPSPPREGRERERSEKVAWGMYTLKLLNQVIWWPWNDLSHYLRPNLSTKCHFLTDSQNILFHNAVKIRLSGLGNWVTKIWMLNSCQIHLLVSWVDISLEKIFQGWARYTQWWNEECVHTVWDGNIKDSELGPCIWQT